MHFFLETSHSKDFALELVKRGAKSCDHILPPFFEPSKISVNEKIFNRGYSKIIVSISEDNFDDKFDLMERDTIILFYSRYGYHYVESKKFNNKTFNFVDKTY